MKPCGCPDWATWVVRCEHKGRRVVAMASPASIKAWAKERWSLALPPRPLRWAILGPAVWDKAVAASLGSTGLHANGSVFFGDKKDAEAEFRRRVKML